MKLLQTIWRWMMLRLWCSSSLLYGHQTLMEESHTAHHRSFIAVNAFFCSLTKISQHSSGISTRSCPAPYCNGSDLLRKRVCRPQHRIEWPGGSWAIHPCTISTILWRCQNSIQTYAAFDCSTLGHILQPKSSNSHIRLPR